MFKTLPVLLCDFYKTTHGNMYPKGTNKIVEYFIPRMSRIQGEDKLVNFACQYYVKKFLIDDFNENFFSRPKEEVMSEYKRVLDHTIGKGVYNYDQVAALHDLGYLPLKISEVPEGDRVDIKVPMIEITNTHPDFAWLVSFIESNMSAELWHAMTSANVGYNYRKIVDKYFDMSVDDAVSHARAIGDFSFRGQESTESATLSSAAYCLSLLNTATVPAIPFLEYFYNCDCTKEDVAFGAVSTEHSVMCSNYAVDGNEITLLKRLLTELYPNNSFSAVCDSYDYDNFVEKIIPQCKKEILEHNGCFLVRGDSGDPVKVVTSTVYRLLDEFGYTLNAKGYKVLPPQIKAIYGDSITPTRLEETYEELIAHKVACNNVVLGTGSFSLQCVEKEGKLLPFTRDTYGIAIKATYCEVNGKPTPIFKAPKEADFKKSPKGMCAVYKDSEGNYTYKDGFDSETIKLEKDNMLKPIFEDGKILKQYTLSEVRHNLHKNF